MVEITILKVVKHFEERIVFDSVKTLEAAIELFKKGEDFIMDTGSKQVFVVADNLAADIKANKILLCSESTGDKK